MVKYHKELPSITDKNCCGGEGQVAISEIISPELLYRKNTFFSFVKMNAGDSVGYHTHSGDMEIYIITRGKAIYNDNGLEIELNVGDVTITFDGEAHSIKPAEGELEFIATLFKNNVLYTKLFSFYITI